MKEMKINTW